MRLQKGRPFANCQSLQIQPRKELIRSTATARSEIDRIACEVSVYQQSHLFLRLRMLVSNIVFTNLCKHSVHGAKDISYSKPRLLSLLHLDGVSVAPRTLHPKSWHLLRYLIVLKTILVDHIFLLKNYFWMPYSLVPVPMSQR